MVAEVEAVRQSVDEERQRLAKRCAELDSEKRQAGAAARQENERLIEQAWLRCIYLLLFLRKNRGKTWKRPSGSFRMYPLLPWGKP